MLSGPIKDTQMIGTVVLFQDIFAEEILRPLSGTMTGWWDIGNNVCIRHWKNGYIKHGRQSTAYSVAGRNQVDPGLSRVRLPQHSSLDFINNL